MAARAGLGQQSTTLTFFISSGADADYYRNQLKVIINDVLNPVLYESESDIHIHPYMWEHSPAQTTASDHFNSEFVRIAVRSDLVIVLLLSEIRPGTKEELIAVLGSEGLQVAVLQFGAVSEDLRNLAREYPNLLYKQTDLHDADGTLHELLRPMLRLLFRQMSGRGGQYVESL